MFGWLSAASALASRRTASHLVRHDFERDHAIEVGVERLVDHAHPALTNLAGQLIRAEPCPDVEGHDCRFRIEVSIVDQSQAHYSWSWLLAATSL